MESQRDTKFHQTDANNNERGTHEYLEKLHDDHAVPLRTHLVRLGLRRDDLRQQDPRLVPVQTRSARTYGK